MALTPEELEYFNQTVARIRLCVSVQVPIKPMDHDELDGKHKEALGVCWAEPGTDGALRPFQITIDEFFIHECYIALERPYLKIEPQTLEEVVAHEIAHLHQWRHGKKHTEITRRICGMIEAGIPLEKRVPA